MVIGSVTAIALSIDNIAVEWRRVAVAKLQAGIVGEEDDEEEETDDNEP